MKFSCDSCGAQYMIADEKIGSRGVKVRCKKCAHVIILRPSVAPPPPAAHTNPSPAPLHNEPPTGDQNIFDQATTSSDMGLSAEFAAAGFDDTQAAAAPVVAARGAVMPSGSRLGDLGSSSMPPDPDLDSPFGSVSMGGSLDQFNDSPNTELSEMPSFPSNLGSAGLRESLPEQDDDLAAPTRVDQAASGTADDDFAGALSNAAGVGEHTEEPSAEADTRVAQIDLPPDALRPLEGEEAPEGLEAKPSDSWGLGNFGDFDDQGGEEDTQSPVHGSAPDDAAQSESGGGAHDFSAGLRASSSQGSDEDSEAATGEVRVTGISMPPSPPPDDEDHAEAPSIGAFGVSEEEATVSADSDRDFNAALGLGADTNLDESLGLGADSSLDASLGLGADSSSSESLGLGADSNLDDALGLGADSSSSDLLGLGSQLGSDEEDESEALTARPRADSGWTPEDGLGDLDMELGLGSKPSPSAEVRHEESTAVGVTMEEAHAKAEVQVSGVQSSSSESDEEAIASQMAGIPQEHLDSELGSAFDAVFGEDDAFGGSFNAQPSSSGPDPFDSLVRSAKDGLETSGIPGEDDRKETRIFDEHAMAKVQAEQDRAVDDEGNVEQVKEWYVAIDDEQVGPLTALQVQGHWDSARIDANALCWKQGMGDWIAVRFVDELAHLVDRPQKKRESMHEPVEERAAVSVGGGFGGEMSHEPMAARSDVAVSGLGALGADSVEHSDEPSWKPSAASALASLAAAELDSSAPATDVQAGPVMPAMRDGGSSGLDGLLESQPRSASLFGAIEETSPSMASALPKAPELASSVSLSRPSVGRHGIPMWMPLSGAILFAGIIVAVALAFRSPEAPVQPAQPALAAAPTAAPANPPPTEPAAAPNTVAMLQGDQPPGTTPAPVPGADNPGAPNPPPTATEAMAAKAEVQGAASDDGADDEGDDKDPTRPTRKRSSKSSSKRTKRSREPKEEIVAPPPPAPSRRTSSKMDDLLENAGRSKGDSGGSDLPDTLDDGDIFKVLKKNGKDIKGCLAQQSKADPSVEGVMTVKLVIKKSGRTSGAKVVPARFQSTVVGKCVLREVKKWRFPKFSGRSIPLDFPVKVRGG